MATNDETLSGFALVLYTLASYAKQGLISHREKAMLKTLGACAHIIGEN